jgi:hypothetical protein
MAPVVALTALLSTGCEDGPNQTFSPAPANAGSIWNGPGGGGGLGDGGAFVGTSTQEYDASFGGTNLNQLCTATTEKAVWSSLFSQAIAVPGVAGGIDIAGGYSTAPEGNCKSNCIGASGYVAGQPYTYDESQETWTGATVEDAEAILCQAVATSVYYGETNTVGWGESLEFSALYVVSSRQITDLLIEPGYAGGLVATNATATPTSPAGTAWNLSMNNLPLTKNGTAVNLTWDLSDQGFISNINDFYNALLDTYQPAFPRDKDCIAVGHCSTFIIPQEAAVNFPAINLTLYFGPPASPQPAPSTVDLMDVGLLKLLPFGTSANLLKLDAAGEGPTATVANIAGSSTTCVYKLGQQFSDFDSTCVQAHPTSDPNQAKDNRTEEAKLFGGYTHSDEAYSFDLSGIDPQFVASSLAPTAVIADGQKPAATDLAFQFEIDTYDLGTVANDYTNNDTTQPEDWHGLGLLTLELAQTIQKYMQTNYGVNTQLGDKACTAAMGAVFDGAGDVVAPYVNPTGKTCSGIEGIVTTAPTASANLPINALGAAAITAIPNASKLALGMKPGTWSSLICFDGGGISGGGVATGYTNCLGGNVNYNGQTTDYFDTLLHAVLTAYSGNTLYAANPSPGDLNNKRFYFEQWILSLVKYLQSADTPTATLAQIDANVVDPNNLFLDSAGAGFDNAQYVFRNTVNAGGGQAPTVVAVTVELNNSSINDYEFDRWNFRGETMLYSALQADPTTALPVPGDNPGAQPLFLSNMVGSALLTTVFGPGTTTTAPDGYECALAAYNPADDATNCTTAGETTTEDLTEYAPSFGTSALNIAAYGAAPTAAPFTVKTTGYEYIQSAMVSLPIWSRPYDPTSAAKTDKLSSELLQYVAAGANVGFSVAIDGSRQKFYNTNETVFSGISVNGVMDWETIPVPGGTPTQTEVVVRAFESQNFLGKVYMCAEPSPTVPGQIDLLGITMYEPATTILNWIAAHPSARADCGIVVQYSIYGNYANIIESNQYGVQVGLNASYGSAVVTDLTIFDTNIIPSLGL